MPRVRIKQLDERTATAGLHFGGSQARRKLHPGEIVELPEGPLFDALWATGKLELTMDPATRPLDYRNAREAQLTSPTYKSRGADEDREIAEAHAAVAARMAEVSDVPANAGSPADDSQTDADVVDSSPAAAPKKPNATNRRAQRRAAMRTATGGQEITT